MMGVVFDVILFFSMIMLMPWVAQTDKRLTAVEMKVDAIEAQTLSVMEDHIERMNDVADDINRLIELEATTDTILIIRDELAQVRTELAFWRGHIVSIRPKTIDNSGSRD